MDQGISSISLNPDTVVDTWTRLATPKSHLCFTSRLVMYILCLNIGRFSMAEAILDIKHWGNNLGVRLPAAVAREAHLHADQRVRVTVEGGRVVIEPIRDESLTLEQRLARFDPVQHGGESMAVGAVGAERW